MDRIDWANVVNKGKHYLVSSLFCKCKNEEIIEFIKKCDSNPIEKKVLVTDLFEEVVGRQGIFLWLKHRYKRVFGMDISVEVIKQFYFNSNLEKNTCVVSDVRKCSYKDASFDLIISDSTLDHFKELTLAIKELYRMLKPGGKLILTLNNKFQILFSSKVWIKRILNIKDYSYGYFYSWNQIKPRLENIGFTIEKFTYLYFFPPILKFLMPKKKGVFYNIYKKIIRNYEGKMRSIPYIKKFTGSNMAVELIKKG